MMPRVSTHALCGSENSCTSHLSSPYYCLLWRLYVCDLTGWLAGWLLMHIMLCHAMMWCGVVWQATLFAMLMALSNFGNAISKYVGTALVLAFNVSNSNFDNFIWVVVSKSFLMMTPILFVPLLIPDGCPQDDDEEDDEDDGTTYGSLRQSILGRRSHKSTHSTHSTSRWSGVESNPPEQTDRDT